MNALDFQKEQLRIKKQAYIINELCLLKKKSSKYYSHKLAVIDILCSYSEKELFIMLCYKKDTKTPKGERIKKLI